LARITTEAGQPGIFSRLAWFVLIWGLSVLGVSVLALLLKWLVLTPILRPH
jgi:hypothetical protein